MSGMALTSVQLRSLRVPQQQHLDSMVSYLSRHGQHVSSMVVRGRLEQPVILRDLPASMQHLQKLCLHRVGLQLCADNGKRGVLAAAIVATAQALTQLQLNQCSLHDYDAPYQLKKTLSQLPNLQRLSLQVVSKERAMPSDKQPFPDGMLQQLQTSSLTHLDLGADAFEDTYMQQVQQLSSLRQLVLIEYKPEDVCPSGLLLSGMHNLTMLILRNIAPDTDPW
jgi:hypothetical protein